MTIERIKRIPIDGLLSHLGHEPVSRMRGGTQLMYHSPLRLDSRPSFFVNTTKNVWNDLGAGMGGNIIDLAIALMGGCTFHAAVMWLESRYAEFGNDQETERRPTYLNPKRPSETDIKDVRVVPLEHRALLSYLMSRGIPVDIGTKYCEEVHYSAFGKEYYGLCFRNVLGGMEIRNVYFKGCYGSKAPSLMPVDKLKHTEACCVFEGFMDFLSYQVLCDRKDPVVVGTQDCIVINSTNLIKKAIPFMDVYLKVYCYLDNDEAGRKAFSNIIDTISNKAESKSHLFCQFNDLNDYLKSKVKNH